MSDYAQQQIKESGIAQVMVFLKQPGQAGAAAADLEKHFTQKETSPQAALANAMSFRAGGGSRAAKPKVPPPMRVFKNLGIMLGTVDQQGLAALRARKDQVQQVTSAPIISLIRPQVRLAAASPKAGVTWGIAAIEADKLWKKGYTGKDVLVGHLDTGLDGKHPALKGAIKAFAEFDLEGDLIEPSPKPHDSDEHGTHTAATIAGRPVKVGAKKSYVGVAPDARLASALVIEGGNVIVRVLGGMDWAVGQGIRVLSMSLGIRGFLDDFQPVTQILRQRNVLPVFAVGNEGAGFSRSPGNYSEALSVGAVDKNGLVADFSSSQRFDRADDPLVPDLVGPGVNVISARPKPLGGFQAMDGTSMATPHIAGLAALLLQAVPAATPDQLEQAIFASCQRGPGMPPDRVNRGLPKGLRALTELMG